MRLTPKNTTEVLWLTIVWNGVRELRRTQIGQVHNLLVSANFISFAHCEIYNVNLATLTCRCMSDAYFLVYHIPASFISVQNIPKLSLQFKVIRKHFLPVLLDAQIKVFCVPDLTSLMLGGQGKIPAVHNFFRRLDPRVFKFLTRVEVVTLGSFKLKGDGEHGYVELDWFYETFPSCESVTSNVSVPRRQVDEL